ncbi:MAG TPA: hypothetical protein VNL77_18985, partial [Roseiflexaceae bacterium]|nr:hypothetical protein [Roseiflexaceae bacterium]
EVAMRHVLARRVRVRAGLPTLALTLLALCIGALPARPAHAAPILRLGVELAPGVTNPIPTGQPFRYRLTYECSGSLITDQCFTMQITTDPLPPALEGLQVVGNSDVIATSYNPATRRATWTFRSPLPPGTTGQLEFEVRFVPGTTPDGTTSTITTRITADGVPPVTATPSTDAVADARDETTVDKVLEAGGAAGDTATYRITVCAGDTGALDFRTVTIIDTLPAGATYVASDPPATSVNTGANPQTVTWSGIANVAAGTCAIFRLTVAFPVPPNAVGNSKINSVSVSGTPFGGTPRTITDLVTHTLTGVTPSMALDKRATTSAAVGAEVVTRLRITNTGNVTLQNVVVEDPIPSAQTVQSIATGPAIAVAYQRNGLPTWITGVPLGFRVAVTSFPGFAAGDYVSALRFTLGAIPPGFDDNSIRIRSIVVNPPNGGGAAYPLPYSVTNTATLTAIYGGTPLTSRQASFTTTVDTACARPLPWKLIVTGNPALPGDTVTYGVGLRNDGLVPLDEPVLADLLPAEVAYVAGSQALAAQIPGCTTPPAFQTITGYNGSGRTLLLWSWAGSGCSLAMDAETSITFQVRVLPGTGATLALPNRAALVNTSTPTSAVNPQNCASGAPEAPLFTNGTGVDITRLCFSPPANLRVDSAASIASEKLVRGQLDAGFHRDPLVGATVRGGLITYSLTLTNTGSVDFRDLRIVDVLPFAEPAPGNRGVRDLLPLGTVWTPRLAGPVTVEPPIPGLTVRYSFETNPCRPELANPNPGCVPMVDGVDPAPGVWSINLPPDPTQVRSLRFDFGSYVLRANQAVRFTFTMLAPADAPIATPGPDGVFGNSDDGNVAWNTFAYSAIRTDDGSQLVAQPPRVGVEVRAGAPTAIALERFTARWEGSSVTVAWTTGAEVNTWGFHLLRSASGRRADAAPVTAAPILGQGRGLGGASYRWIDQSAEAGRSYSYWLVESEIGGATHEYGPASTAPGVSIQPGDIFLPLIGN